MINIKYNFFFIFLFFSASIFSQDGVSTDKCAGPVTFEEKNRQKMEQYMATQKGANQTHLTTLMDQLAAKRKELASLSSGGVSGGRNTKILNQAKGMSANRERAERLQGDIARLEQQVKEAEQKIASEQEKFISYQKEIDEEREFENQFGESFQWYSLALEGYTEEEYQSKNAMYDIFLMGLADVAKNRLSCSGFSYNGNVMDTSVKSYFGSGRVGGNTAADGSGGIVAKNVSFKTDSIAVKMWQASSGAYLLAYMDYLRKYNENVGCTESRFSEQRNKRECSDQLQTLCQGGAILGCYNEYKPKLDTKCQGYSKEDLGAVSGDNQQRESIAQAVDLYSELEIVTGSKETMAARYEELLDLVIDQAKKEMDWKKDQLDPVMEEYYKAKAEEENWWNAWVISMIVFGIGIALLPTVFLSALGAILFYAGLAAAIITSVGYYAFAKPRMEKAVANKFKTLNSYRVVCNYDQAVRLVHLKDPVKRQKFVNRYHPKKRPFISLLLNVVVPEVNAASDAQNQQAKNIEDMNKKVGLQKLDTSMNSFKFFMVMQREVWKAMAYDVRRQPPSLDQDRYYFMKAEESGVSSVKEQTKNVLYGIDSNNYKGVPHAEIRHTYFINVKFAIQLAKAQMGLAAGLAGSRLRIYQELLDKVDDRYQLDAKNFNMGDAKDIRPVSQNCMSKGSTGVVGPVPCSSCAGACTNTFKIGDFNKAATSSHLHTFDNYTAGRFTGQTEEAQIKNESAIRAAAATAKKDNDRYLESKPFLKENAESFLDDTLTQIVDEHSKSNLDGKGTYRNAMKEAGIATVTPARYRFGNKEEEKKEGEEKEVKEKTDEKVVAKKIAKNAGKATKKKDDKKKGAKEFSLDMDLDLDFGDDEGENLGLDANIEGLDFGSPKAREKRAKQNEVFLKKPVEEVVNKDRDSIWDIISDAYQGMGIRYLGRQLKK